MHINSDTSGSFHYSLYCLILPRLSFLCLGFLQRADKVRYRVEISRFQHAGVVITFGKWFPDLGRRLAEFVEFAHVGWTREMSLVSRYCLPREGREQFGKLNKSQSCRQATSVF